MIKKVLYFLCILLGMYIMAGPLLEAFDIIAISISKGRALFLTNAFLNTLIYIVAGVLLIRFGYREFNPRQKKKKDGVEDIGK